MLTLQELIWVQTFGTFEPYLHIILQKYLGPYPRRSAYKLWMKLTKLVSEARQEQVYKIFNVPARRIGPVIIAGYHSYWVLNRYIWAKSCFLPTDPYLLDTINQHDFFGTTVKDLTVAGHRRNSRILLRQMRSWSRRQIGQLLLALARQYDVVLMSLWRRLDKVVPMFGSRQPFAYCEPITDNIYFFDGSLVEVYQCYVKHNGKAYTWAEFAKWSKSVLEGAA